MNFPMIVLLCFVCCLFSCRVTKDTRTLTEIVVMGKTYKRRSKLLEATALEIVVTDTGNTALKLEAHGRNSASIQSQRQALLHYLS